MRILIYGAGAVGQALGCMLASIGEEVHLVLRQRFLGAIAQKGLKVSGIFGEYRAGAADLRLYTDSAAIDQSLRFDFVIVTTKAYDTGSAASALARLADQKFVVVTMQNGCGNLETLTERFGPERTLAARIITGFEILSPGTVNITVTADAVQIGGSREGSIPDNADRLARVIDKAGLPCRPTPYVQRHLFAKLLYNCALNPLGAILGVHYGALADNMETRVIMNRIIHETFAVIEAMGAKTLWQSAEEYITYFLDNQVPATYHHRPSMLQDLEAGKRTEIEALNGYVSKMAKKLDIATPVCDTLSSLIRFHEQTNLTDAQPDINL